jgi:hypothetical protein
VSQKLRAVQARSRRRLAQRGKLVVRAGEGEVLAFDADQLRPAECAGEAEEDDGAVVQPRSGRGRRPATSFLISAVASVAVFPCRTAMWRQRRKDATERRG